jgi:hypothetical protein
MIGDGKVHRFVCDQIMKNEVWRHNEPPIKVVFGIVDLLSTLVESLSDDSIPPWLRFYLRADVLSMGVCVVSLSDGAAGGCGITTGFVVAFGTFLHLLRP